MTISQIKDGFDQEEHSSPLATSPLLPIPSPGSLTVTITITITITITSIFVFITSTITVVLKRCVDLSSANQTP